MDYTNKNVLIGGIGLSGKAIAKLMESKDAIITFYDAKDKNLIDSEELNEEKYNYILGAEPGKQDLEKIDLIILSPGMPTDLKYLDIAKEMNIPVIGEIQLGFDNFLGSLIAITGTNGKTTTTALVGEIIKDYFQNTKVVGNIGVPFSGEVHNSTEDSVYCLEVSSYMLETVTTFKPKVAAVINLSPDHLIRHKTYENYILAKKRIFENQDSEDFLVLNYDDEICRSFEKDSKGKVLFFSKNAENNVENDFVFYDNETIYWKNNNEVVEIIKKDEIKILGMHNIENIMAGCCIAIALEIPLDIIRKGIREFSGVEHRIEFVKTINGVDFYNDSKGTNVDATVKAIEAMEKPIVLILGGYDKKISFDDIGSVISEKVNKVILIGQTIEKAKNVLDKYNFSNYKISESFDNAIDISLDWALEGECVLFSPATSSFDLFRNFEERGKYFKNYLSLKGGYDE